MAKENGNGGGGKALAWIGGVFVFLGLSGVAAYYALKDRVVETGTMSGFTWRVVKRGALFCGEIRDDRPGPAGFAAAGCQKLDCHDRANLAKGEALEAIVNLTADAGALLGAQPQAATYVGVQPKVATLIDLPQP